MSQRDLSGWLPNLVGPLDWQANGGAFPARRAIINFKGGVTVADDPVNGRTDIEITGAAGRETITFANANVTLTATQAKASIIKLAGSNVATRDLIFPVPTEGQSREYHIEMGTTGAGVRLTTGTGSTWTIPPASGGAVHVAIVTPSGVTVSGPAGSGAGEVQYRASTGYVQGLALGTAGQVLKVNAGGTSIEWGAGGGGSTPTGTGVRKVVAGVENAAASLVVNADVDAAAAIAGTKVAPDFGAQLVATTGDVSLGTGTKPAAGTIRFGDTAGNTDRIKWRYSGTDYAMLTSNGSSGEFYFGHTSLTCGVYGSSMTVYAGIGSTFVYGAGVLSRQIDGVTDQGAIPQVGLNSPFGSDGRATQATADANQTLAAAIYSRHIIRFTGTNTAQRTMTFPHPASEDASYTKTIINDTVTNGILVSTGTGATHAMAVNSRALLNFSPAGVQLVAS